MGSRQLIETNKFALDTIFIIQIENAVTQVACNIYVIVFDKQIIAMCMVNELVVCLRSLYSFRASSAPLVRGVIDSSQVDDGCFMVSTAVG